MFGLQIGRISSWYSVYWDCKIHLPTNELSCQFIHTLLYMLNQNNFSLWWSPINASRSMWQNYPNSRHYMPRKLAFCALKCDDLLVCIYIQVPYLSKFSFVFFFNIQQCCIYMKKLRSSDVNLEWKNSWTHT